MKLSNEAKIGMMVTVAVILLVILTVKTGNFHLSNKGYAVRVHFQNIDGVSTNSPVMFNGFEVGRVKDILIKDEPDGVKMELVVWLNEGVRVHEGAAAYVKNMGFLGEKYVGLTAGEATKGYLKENDLIVGNEPADLDRILADGQTIASEIKTIATAVSEKLKKNDQAIDRIFSNLDTTMANVSSITGNVNERLAVNKNNIDETLLNVKSTSVNLDLMTYDLMMNPWKILFRSKDQKTQNREYLLGNDKK